MYHKISFFISVFVFTENFFKIMRMDGLVTKLQEREKRVNLFQTDKSYSVFLLTTQVEF